MDGRSSGLHGAKVLFGSFVSEALDNVRWSCRCSLDREHEHCVGRQQEALSELWANPHFDSLYDYDVLGVRSVSCFSGDGISMRNGLYRACFFGSKAFVFPMEAQDPHQNPRKSQDHEPALGHDGKCDLPSGRLLPSELQRGDSFDRPKFGTELVPKSGLLLCQLLGYLIGGGVS